MTEKATTMKAHVGDLVEIRSKEEILATLDKNGRLDGMPFMPQMFQYCGKRARIYKSAHKTCDPIYTTASRRLDDAIHLNLRCDGTGYDGCQAGCLLFWKTAWLKPVPKELPPVESEPASSNSERPASGGCSEEDVWKATHVEGENGVTRYICQNTLLPEYTKALPWWNPMQYVEDWWSGNVTLSDLARGGFFVLLGRRFGTHFPLIRNFYNKIQSMTGGLPSPMRGGTVPVGQPQPELALDLKPGELVRIKSHDEILATIDTRNRHKGLYFDAELVPFCGGVYKVRGRVERFIDERTGLMRRMKTPAVILETVWCRSRFSTCRMFCPRSIYSWWREAWLERVPNQETARAEADASAPAE